MSKFQLLCVTMHQNDFSKIEEMNIHSDVVFANQCDHTSFETFEFDGHTAKMISTETRGVGINRNLALNYAEGEICLFADDDIKYIDNLEQVVLKEFEACPKADIIIFHLDTDSKGRKQRTYPKTRKHGRFERMPWGTIRVAFRLEAMKRANLWFNTLFGGGCVFPSGEDSIWLSDAKRKGLKFYVSKETIGTVSFAESTWFTGYDEKYFYGIGACYAAMNSKTVFAKFLYTLLRTRGAGELSLSQKLRFMRYGKDGYKRSLSFKDYMEKIS